MDSIFSIVSLSHSLVLVLATDKVTCLCITIKEDLISLHTGCDI